MLVIGAEAGAEVALTDGDLAFTGITLRELHLSTPGQPLDPTSRAALEDVASLLVQQILDTALNDALPAVPIPSLPLPAAVAGFGLPAGAVLGVGSPQLSNVPPHFVLAGSFEVIP